MPTDSSHTSSPSFPTQPRLPLAAFAAPELASGQAPFADYVDMREAARVIGIQRQTLRRIIARGRLAIVRFAGKHLIQREQLEMFRSQYDRRPGRKRWPRLPLEAAATVELGQAPFADYLDVREAARVIGIQPGTVRRIIARGRLATVRFGCRHLIRREQLEMFRANYVYPRPAASAEERRARRRSARARNPEPDRVRNREYARQNRERLAQKQREWRARNRERVNARQRVYDRRNRGRVA